MIAWLEDDDIDIELALSGTQLILKKKSIRSEIRIDFDDISEMTLITKNGIQAINIVHTSGELYIPKKLLKSQQRFKELLQLIQKKIL